MNNPEIVQQEIMTLAQQVQQTYSGAYGDWARRVVGGVNGWNLEDNSRKRLESLKIVLSPRHGGVKYNDDNIKAKLDLLINKWENLERINKLASELQTERESTQQALQTSQEWHERQKAELIAQWKTKLQTFIDKRKSQLRQEIELIREVLHE